MPYIVSADVVSRIGNQKAAELTTDSGSVPDAALIDAIIAEVEAKIDAAVQKRTAEPITLAVFPKLFVALKGCAIALVRWEIHARRPPVPEDWTKAKDAANAWLAQIASGDLALPDAGAVDDDIAWGGNDQVLTEFRE